MGKTYKKQHDYDEPPEDFHDDHKDKRRAKRFERALKTKNIDELLEYDDDEDGSQYDIPDGTEL